MKAILFHQHGGLEVLQYADFPTPEPKAKVNYFERSRWISDKQ